MSNAKRGTGKTRNIVRMPATKFAHLRKKASAVRHGVKLGKGEPKGRPGSQK